MRTETTRQFNAIAAILTLIEDAKIPKTEFYLEVEDEEVIQIASNEKVELRSPGFMNINHYWCVIHKGAHRIHVKGRDKTPTYL